MDKIAVLLPCYNEEQTIGKVVTDFINVFQGREGVTVYVYDNNSTDRTAEIAEKAGAVVRREYKQGKGNVVRRMFREIDAECYIMADGDDTYPAESAPEMVDQVLLRQADMVVGDRLSSTYFKENKRPFHGIGNTLVRTSINLLFHSDIKDMMTGYRAFSYQFVKSFPVLSKGFEIETEMSIHAIDKNMNTVNVIIPFRDRPQGSESKLSTFRDGFRVLKTIGKMYRTYVPMMFFGAIAAILFVLAVIFIIPVLIEYFSTGFVYHYPTLFVCGITVLASFTSLFSGMILDNLRRRDREAFEMELIRLKDVFEEKKDK